MCICVYSIMMLVGSYIAFVAVNVDYKRTKLHQKRLLKWQTGKTCSTL